MTESKTSTAIAQQERPTPKTMVTQYQDSFAAVLPSHITRPETWIRVAQGALKKGKRNADGRTDLEVAAANNPAVFLATLLDCARMGLEPGTEQYYLTPRKVKGRLEILGIIGYQGIVELMYRAGYVSSVVAECVYEHDTFTFSPGRDEIPNHEIDWDAEDRGKLRLVYAYAVMKGGGYSKVIVLNRQAISQIKASAQGADTAYSPWKTNEDAMWLKSAVRQLRKWVPTSAEIRGVHQATHSPVVVQTSTDMSAPELPPDLPEVDSEYDADDEIVEAELLTEGEG